MVVFEDIEDVREWLEPLGYAAFWAAIAPWDVFSDEDRAHCDGAIADGFVPEATVLACMKAIARITITDRFELRPRLYEPQGAQYLKTTH